MQRRQFFEKVGAGSLAAFSRFQPRSSFPAEGAEQDVYGRREAMIEVSLDNIAWNLAQVKKRAKVPVMAVVKANAYGHGLVEVSKALEKSGVDCLMVGKLQEAVQLRTAGVKCPILNFGPFDGRDSEIVVVRDISQAVCADDVRALNEAAGKSGKKASVHVDIDTGMSRTGIPHSRALPLIEKISSLPHVRIDGVATTLTEDRDYDREQLKRFLDVCAAAGKKGISLGRRHAASSAGLFSPPEFHLDMVRPGIALYGYYPNAQTRKEDLLNLKPALKLTARVVFVKDLMPGDSISYLRVFTARKAMRVATVGIGYSDGYVPQLGGKGFVLIGDKKFPIMAAVTSNHLMVDLAGDSNVQIGDEVVLIDSRKNAGLSAADLSEACGISDYKILIGLSPFLPRAYLKPA